MTVRTTVHSAAYHRNGVSGEPFYVGVVTDPFGDGENNKYLIHIVPEYDDEGEFAQYSATMVIRLDLIPDVRFGVNSWRGDRVLQSVLDEIREAAQENHYAGRHTI